MLNFNPFAKQSLAIDLGNSNTLVRDKDRLLVSQPSCIVFDTVNNSVKAVGDQAYSMFEKNHEALKAVRPLRGGVIADYHSACSMIRELVNQTASAKKFLPRSYDSIISGIPYSTTQVERRALRDALDQFNTTHTHLIYEPLAAALGMGLDIREPEGKMVIDFGGGITEIVVISLSGIAAFQSVRIAGDTFDEAIQDHFRRNYNMAIGLRTAEQVKIQVGSVLEKLNDAPEPIVVKGKNFVEGIPAMRKINHVEVAQILDKSIRSIETSILQTLESCPPELAADIYTNGIYVTGGNAYLRGLKERLGATFGLPIHIDMEPLESVSKGVARTLSDKKKFKSVLLD